MWFWCERSTLAIWTFLDNFVSYSHITRRQFMGDTFQSWTLRHKGGLNSELSVFLPVFTQNSEVVFFFLLFSLIIPPPLARRGGDAATHLAVTPSQKWKCSGHQIHLRRLHPLPMLWVTGLRNVLWHDIGATHMLTLSVTVCGSCQLLLLRFYLISMFLAGLFTPTGEKNWAVLVFLQ